MADFAYNLEDLSRYQSGSTGVSSMRISSIPALISATPVKPVHRVVRRNTSLTAEPVEHELPTTPPVTTSVSEFAANRSKDDTVEDKAYKKRNPLWNTMLNL